MSADDPKQPLIQPAAFAPRRAGEGRRRFRASPLQVTLALALLVFAVSLWFLFTARSVLFTFEPPHADMDIDGGLSIRLGERHLLRPGRYRLSVEAEGYHTLEQRLEVTAEDFQTHHLMLEPLPGKLSFTSAPAGATVLIDDQPLGVTPLQDISVAAGGHQLRLLAERHLPHLSNISVAGMEIAQTFDIDLEPAWANIAIASIPAGATVLVDGEALGQTPALLEILQGERQIMLEKPRYRSWRQSLSVNAGEHQKLEPVRLSPADGTLVLSSTPASANVTVNGQYQGQTPLELSLKPSDEHNVSVLKPGYKRASRTLSLNPEERRDLHLKLKAQLGDVLVQVEPASAEILVNGESMGRGTQTLSLPSFEQTLVVQQEGYRRHRQRFTPRPELKQSIQVRLLTESEAKLAALKAEITSPAGQTLKLFTPSDFTMGTSRREPGRRANEVLHPVTLTRLFYLGTHEVTNRQFRKFRKQHGSGFIEGNSLNRDYQPVVMVSWADAARYCNWLSEQEKLPPFYIEKNGNIVGFDINSHGYRLPTEAEWAWAARTKGDTLLKFPWGHAYPPPKATGNYADTSSAYITGRRVQNYTDGHIVAAPVGSFPANHRGLYDMGGNVAEWVHDVYSLPGSSGTPLLDPLGAQQGSNHVVRGASWVQGTVTELRLSFRDYGDEGRDDLGFRIARFAEEAP